MMSEMSEKTAEESFVMFPQKNKETSELSFLDEHKDQAIQTRILGDRKTKNEAKRAQEGTFSRTNVDAVPNPNPDPINSIPQSQDIPGLEELLREFEDVLTADLQAELPVELEFEMKIPIKPGTTPP
eukprot:2113203-Rhodomonas_salina.1